MAMKSRTGLAISKRNNSNMYMRSLLLCIFLITFAHSANGKTVMIDFGGPNVAKPMHVGHLRSSIIGDCLQRLYRANGWRVISDVHLGDWGLQMGQLITEIEIMGIAPIYFDVNVTGPYPDESPVSMEDLETIYPEAAAACKASFVLSGPRSQRTYRICF